MFDNLSDIKKTKSNLKETYNVAYIGTPILTEKIQDLNQFYKSIKDFTNQISNELLYEIKASGIQGKGMRFRHGIQVGIM